MQSLSQLCFCHRFEPFMIAVEFRWNVLRLALSSFVNAVGYLTTGNLETRFTEILYCCWQLMLVDLQNSSCKAKLLSLHSCKCINSCIKSPFWNVSSQTLSIKGSRQPLRDTESWLSATIVATAAWRHVRLWFVWIDSASLSSAVRFCDESL